MERQKDGVRSSITSCLTRVLCSDQQARRVAEEELKTLEVTEGHLELIKIVLLHDSLVVSRFWSSAC